MTLRRAPVHLAAACAALLAQSAAAFVVEDIELVGLERLDAATVFTYLPLEVGEEFDEARSAEILRALFETQLFSDVQLSRRDDVLVVTVAERPAITEIGFEGLEVIADEALQQVLAEAGIATGRIYNQQLLDRLRTEILQQYHTSGHYNAAVDVEVEELDGNLVRIGIVVEEGEPAYIRQIRLIGNASYPDADLLELFESETPSWYGGILGDGGRYSKVAMQGDLERLRTHYLNRGYLDFRIDDVQIALSQDRGGIFITVHITEGKRYAVREVALSGVFVVPRADLLPSIRVAAGEYYSNRYVQLTAELLTQKLGEEGYAFAKVNPVTERDDAAGEVEVNFFLDPGQRVYVRRINITGNSITQDEALRRELRQLEGAWLSPPNLERSRRRLQRLPYIDAADIAQERVPGSSNQVDLTVRVSERLAGNFSIGAGFSSGSGFTLSTGVEQENFLGTGNRVGFAFNNSDIASRYSFDFHNPYYTINGVSRGFGFVFRTIDTSDDTTADDNITDYESDDTSAYLTYGIPISDDSFFTVTTRLDNLSLEATSTTSREVNQFLYDHGGACAVPPRMANNTTQPPAGCEADYANFPLAASFRYDTRNRSLFASEGSLREIGAQVTIPGSDLEFYTLSYRQEEYLPITEDVSVSVRGELAYGGAYGGTEDLPFFEKFVTGGPRSVRGYELNSLAPKDSNLDPFGGDFKVNYSIEMLFPVPYVEEANLRGVAFLDAGYVYGDVDEFDLGDLRAAVGVGISWLSPLGGVSLNLSFPFNDQEGDETERFQFNLGTL